LNDGHIAYILRAYETRLDPALSAGVQILRHIHDEKLSIWADANDGQNRSTRNAA
jgi:hypothetical protein